MQEKSESDGKHYTFCIKWHGTKKEAVASATASVHFIGGPGVIRTLDLLVRSQTLYPAELRSHYRTVIIIRESGWDVKLFLKKTAGTAEIPEGQAQERLGISALILYNKILQNFCLEPYEIRELMT